MLILEQNQRSRWRGRRDFGLTRILPTIERSHDFIGKSARRFFGANPFQSSLVLWNRCFNHVVVTLQREVLSDSYRVARPLYSELTHMTIVLVVVASLIAVLSLAFVSNATSGVAGVCIACFLGIMARIYQAGEQHRAIVRHLGKPLLVFIALALCVNCNAIAVPPTSPSVVAPIVPDSPQPELPSARPIELLLSLGRGEVHAGEGVSLLAIPIKGEVFAPAVYDWTFGDGSTETTDRSTTGHVYAQGGEYPASVRVRDRDGRQAEASTVVIVAANRPRPPSDRPPPPPPPCPTITLAPSTLPDGTVGSNYSRKISATGGKAPYGFSVSSGTLPAGLLLSDTGVLSGTPTTAGTSTFVVNGSDSNSCGGKRSYTVTIADKPGVMTATMSCTARSTITFDASCNVTGTYNGATVPSASVTRVDWDWGDGSTSISTSPAQTKTYAQPGTYTVIGVMTADTADGQKTATASKSVTVPKPTP